MTGGSLGAARSLATKESSCTQYYALSIMQTRAKARILAPCMTKLSPFPSPATPTIVRGRMWFQSMWYYYHVLHA